MKAYSMDLRERIVQAVEFGMTKAAAARTFRVNVSTVKVYMKRQARGELAAKVSPGRPPRIRRAQYPDLVAQLDASPDATLEEHCQTWEKAHGTKPSITAMHRAIKRCGWTVKKR